MYKHIYFKLLLIRIDSIEQSLVELSSVATGVTTGRRKNYFKIQRSCHDSLLRKTIEKT